MIFLTEKSGYGLRRSRTARPSGKFWRYGACLSCSSASKRWRKSLGNNNLRRQFFQQRGINSGTEGDFRDASFSLDFQFVITPAFVVLFKHDAYRLNDFVLRR